LGPRVVTGDEEFVPYPYTWTKMMNMILIDGVGLFYSELEENDRESPFIAKSKPGNELTGH
jgi:hypothetical protein